MFFSLEKFEKGLVSRNYYLWKVTPFLIFLFTQFLLEARHLSWVPNVLGYHALEVGLLGGTTRITNFADYDHEKSSTVVNKHTAWDQ